MVRLPSFFFKLVCSFELRHISVCEIFLAFTRPRAHQTCSHRSVPGDRHRPRLFPSFGSGLLAVLYFFWFGSRGLSFLPLVRTVLLLDSSIFSFRILLISGPPHRVNLCHTSPGHGKQSQGYSLCLFKNFSFHTSFTSDLACYKPSHNIVRGT